MSQGTGTGGLIFMAVIWIGLLIVFDAVLGSALVNTWTAKSSFVETPAEVLRTEIKVDSDGDSTSYTPIVEYRYTFDGVEYEADRLNYVVFGGAGNQAAKEVLKRFEVGSTVSAWVDPSDPAEAVLDTSMEAFPGGVVLFLTPFHGIGLGLLWILFNRYREKRSGRDPYRARFIKVESENDVVIEKPMLSPVAIALIALIGASFAATFPVVFILGFDAPLSKVMPIWFGCFAVAAAFGFARWMKKRSPESYLHIDRVRGVYSYPADAEGHPLSEVIGVKHRSKATGTTINDVVQHHIHYVADTTEGDVRLFDVKMGEDDGDRLQELLQLELLDG